MNTSWSIVGWMTLALSLATACPSGASLTPIGTADISGIGTGYHLFYDDDAPFGSVVWLDYTHLGFDWWGQRDWAVGLNNAGTITYHVNRKYTVTWEGDWRLPISTEVEGYHQNGSEMGHLYYSDLGKQAGAASDDMRPFRNLVANWYWSGTGYDIFPNYTWFFATCDGSQNAGGNDLGFSAIALRAGEVESEAVPEPGTLLLVGVGLAGITALRLLRRVR